MKENNFSVFYVSILFVVYGVLAQVVLRWQRTPGQFWPIRKTQATDLQTSTPDICWSPGVWNIVGPILHPAQLTFYTDACILASFHPAQSWFSPAATRPSKFHIHFTMATMRLLNALNVKCKWLEVSLADPPLPIQLTWLLTRPSLRLATLPDTLLEAMWLLSICNPHKAFLCVALHNSEAVLEAKWYPLKYKPHNRLQHWPAQPEIWHEPLAETPLLCLLH